MLSFNRTANICLLLLLASVPVFGQGKVQEPPLDVLEEIVRIAPDNADARYKLGAAYFHLKLYKDAINAFKQELRITPESSRAFKALGITMRF